MEIRTGSRDETRRIRGAPNRATLPPPPPPPPDGRSSWRSCQRAAAARTEQNTGSRATRPVRRRTRWRRRYAARSAVEDMARVPQRSARTRQCRARSSRSTSGVVMLVAAQDFGSDRSDDARNTPRRKVCRSGGVRVSTSIMSPGTAASTSRNVPACGRRIQVPMRVGNASESSAWHEPTLSAYISVGPVELAVLGERRHPNLERPQRRRTFPHIPGDQ